MKCLNKLSFEFVIVINSKHAFMIELMHEIDQGDEMKL